MAKMAIKYLITEICIISMVTEILFYVMHPASDYIIETTLYILTNQSQKRTAG